jgi:MOSC domain-containing protein YiiM
LKGRVVAVCRSSERGKPKEDIRSGFFEKGMGLSGDAHAGTEKEVSLLAQDRVHELSKKASLSFPPGAFAENLLIAGLDQAEMVPGKRLKVGKAILQITQIGKEAGIQHTYHYQGFSLLPRFGIFAQVIESGIIKNGDEVELLIDSP